MMRPPAPPRPSAEPSAPDDRATAADVSVVLDDDPTGTQAVHDVRVLLRWSPATVRAALAGGASAVHLMTNARALAPRPAAGVTADAAAAARAGAPGARIVLRGDSTLRGHLLEEYLAVDPAAASVLLLVPALPAAGRVTRGGVHLIERDGRAEPVHRTEYARDGAFSYRTSRLLDWAHERSGGLLDAGRGTEVALDRLRVTDGGALAEALAGAAAAGGPAACAPDAETLDDLALIAAGLRAAEAAGVRVTVRCAPAFAGVLSGRLATAPAAPPPVGSGVLVVCGSYVSSTTAQLVALRERRGVEIIELDPRALAGPQRDAARALAPAARRADAALAARRLAVVATARERPPETRSLEAGLQIAHNLASIVPALRTAPGVVVAKGGITSHVTLQHGLGADAATVAGPLLRGVALWRADGPAGEVGYVVVPGNVGGPELLVELIDRLGVGAGGPGAGT